jgi:hypothetical protein
MWWLHLLSLHSEIQSQSGLHSKTLSQNNNEKVIGDL